MSMEYGETGAGDGSDDEEFNLQPTTPPRAENELLPANTEDTSTESDTLVVPARAHSYLPGTCHPLDIETNRTDQFRGSYYKSNDPFELIILELPGVVLFPGMTIPLRLEEPGSFSMSSSFWMLYRQIQMSRRSPGQSATVQVGVLTKLDPADEGLDQDDNQSATAVSNEARQRRRSSWMRRAFGPERIRRFSEQIIQELGDVEEFLNIVESVDEVLLDGPIRPPPARPRARNSWIGGARHSFGPRRQPSGDDDTEASSQEEVAFLHRRPGNRRDEINSGLPLVQVDPNDPYANRIGTLATVTYTHGDDSDVLGTNDEDFANRDRPRARASLVLTAVGTGRFRILAQNYDTSNNQRSNPTTAGNTDFYYHRLFVRTVQEWSYERIPTRMPPACVIRGTNAHAKYDVASHAAVSVWPRNIYENYWPWKLMEDLRRKIEETASLNEVISGQEKNVPQNPYKFSYWLASHLPLSERERIQVLQCPTVSERLRWFLHHPLFFVEPEGTGDGEHEAEAEEQPDHCNAKELICRSCQIPITSANHLFTLGGAEGTVGNYVNPHGVVHATMTVRQVDLNEVVFYGRSETKDSWFPGYAWTIMSCALCNAHLGWKFSLVNNAVSSSTFRPAHFYGLSATGVTMRTNVRRPRRLSSSRNGSRRTRQRSMASESSVG